MDICKNICPCKSCSTDQDDCDLAKAYDKQIPKLLTDNVKNTSGSTGDYIATCPTCNHHILVYRRECNCDKCGQRVQLGDNYDI